MSCRQLTSLKRFLAAGVITLVLGLIPSAGSVYAQDVPEPTPSDPPSRKPDSDRRPPSRRPESEREDPTDDETEEPLDVETVRRSVEGTFLLLC